MAAPAARVLPLKSAEKEPLTVKVTFTVPPTFYVGCWCGASVVVRYDKTGKPYLSCENCGALTRLKSDRAIRILARRARTKGGFTVSATFGTEKYVSWCRRLNKKRPRPKPRCHICQRELFYHGKGRPPETCQGAGLRCRGTLIPGVTLP